MRFGAWVQRVHIMPNIDRWLSEIGLRESAISLQTMKWHNYASQINI